MGLSVFEEILMSRGLSIGETRETFLNPDYDAKHDPFLLPDMDRAIERLVKAHHEQEHITIYGDYDIDGLTATALLYDAFKKFGFEHINLFIPNRFVEGYGLSVDAIDRIVSDGASLIITVDCGSLSHKEIIHADKNGVDVIVTDHHNVADTQPPAVAVINPKRLLTNHSEEYEDYILKKDSKMSGKIYPFLDLSGVGVAFKLVQAMQTKLHGLPLGQEKWLLDLVAFGTVCDVVNITNENRVNVFWGLKVLSKTKRKGLRALMVVTKSTPEKLSSKTLGFVLGPRLNASGRIETAQYAIDLLTTEDASEALRLAQKLDVLNTIRKNDQEKIFKEACAQAEHFLHEKVLVLSNTGWSHGIVGIVAAKLLEKYKKPTFVLEELGENAKGSARSYGDFSVADAIKAAGGIVIKGGGHKYAAGVTLQVKDVVEFRRRVNDYYRTQKLFNQEALLLPHEDVVAPITSITDELIEQILTMEPFGNGNPEPIISSQNLRVIYKKPMGAEGQHVKLGLQDINGGRLYLIAFGAHESFYAEIGERVTVWYRPMVNEWQGRRNIEGHLLRLERA